MIRFLPLVGFFLLVTLLYFGLGNNPRDIPSPLIGKPVPQFELPQLYDPAKTVKPDDMKGKVWLLNVWASWCTSCVAEHEVVTKLVKKNKLDVMGLNYKDEPVNAKSWLGRYGNPYSVIAVDKDGRIAIDWGVYGVPESYVVDKKGIIRYKFTGPIDDKSAKEIIEPLLKELRAEAA